jgi:hypothetical protein
MKENLNNNNLSPEYTSDQRLKHFLATKDFRCIVPGCKLYNKIIRKGTVHAHLPLSSMKYGKVSSG